MQHPKQAEHASSEVVGFKLEVESSLPTYALSFHLGGRDGGPEASPIPLTGLHPA